MKVFYTASYNGKKKYQKDYNRVLRAIEKTDVDLISPEVGGYQTVLSQREKDRLADPKLIHYESIKRGIILCDATIIEISNEDFQLGHEATLAILNKKPVLCLSVIEDFSMKIRNPYFSAAKYNEFNVDEIISDFIYKVEKRILSVRFNMLLSQRQIDYLEKRAKETGYNKSEYLRLLLDEDMS